MKVDMDGKNSSLSSEHTPLDQTNTKKAENYKICEYLESIPGIHSETISFLKSSESDTVKLTDNKEKAAKSFWTILCDDKITMPRFKMFPSEASINTETVDIYLFKKLMGDDFRSAPENSLLSYMFDGQNTINAPAEYPTFLTQFWCHKETHPLAPTLTLILSRDYTHKSPKCFRQRDHVFTDSCSLSTLRDYLCALLPEKRRERFEKNHAYNSMLFSGAFLTREFFLLLGAMKMLYKMAAENLLIRKRKVNENSKAKTSDSSSVVPWDVYEQAVLFSLFLTNPLKLLLDWQELARKFPELNCEATTDSASRISSSVDPHVQFEHYVCAVLAPIFCTCKNTCIDYQKAWDEFSRILEKKSWKQEDENSILRDLQDPSGSTSNSILNMYLAPKLIHFMKKDGFHYLFQLFYCESAFTGMLTAPTAFPLDFPPVYMLFFCNTSKPYKQNVSLNRINYKVPYLKTYNDYINELFCREAEDNSTEKSSVSEEVKDDKTHPKSLPPTLSEEADLYKEYIAAYDKLTKPFASICSTDIGYDIFLRYRWYLNVGW